MASRFYRHSGKVPPLAMIVAPLVCFAFAILAGSLFGYLEFLAHLLPAAKLLLIAITCALVGISILLGTIPARLFRRLNARSTPALLLLTFLQSCVALYCAWVFWIVAFLNYINIPVRLRLATPTALWHFIQIIDQHGIWSLGFGARPTGLALAAIWLGEAAVILALSVAWAQQKSVENVFCEHCGKWGVVRPLMQISPLSSDQLRTDILAGNFDLLTHAERSESGEDCWNDIVLEGCDTCDNLQTLTVTRVLRLRSERKTEIKSKKILHRLVISPEQTASLAQTAAVVMMPPPSREPSPLPLPMTSPDGSA
jgi:hypothetical protein